MPTLMRADLFDNLVGESLEESLSFILISRKHPNKAFTREEKIKTLKALMGDCKDAGLSDLAEKCNKAILLLTPELRDDKGEDKKNDIPSITGDADIDYIIDIQNQNLKEAWREDKSAYSMENDDMRYMSFLAKQERVGDLKRGNLVART